MAYARGLLPGFTYTITSGKLAGVEIIILDNNPFPDNDPRRRKVTVRMPDGSVGYFLPRQLSDNPTGQVPAFAQPNWAPPTILDTPQSIAQGQGIPANQVELLPPPFITVAEQVAPIGPLPATPQGQVVKPITDPMDPRLDHLRPDVGKYSEVARYIHRVMPNGMKDVDFLLTFASDAYRAENQGHPVNLSLVGDTQGGKTLMVGVLAWAWAQKLGFNKPMPIFTLSGSAGVTDFDLFGQMTAYNNPVTGKEELVWLPGIVDLAAQCGGILYLDEMNAMHGNVTSSLHSVIDHRHLFVNRNKVVDVGGQKMPETVFVSLDTWVIATYNEGYRDMGQMNEAYKQRFEHIIWDYDEAVERALVKSPTILLLAQALRTNRASAMGIRTPFGTSAMKRFKRNVETFGPETAGEILLGMFPANERGVVKDILNDRSIILLLQEEAKAAEQHAAAVAGQAEQTEESPF